MEAPSVPPNTEVCRPVAGIRAPSAGTKFSQLCLLQQLSKSLLRAVTGYGEAFIEGFKQFTFVLIGRGPSSDDNGPGSRCKPCAGHAYQTSAGKHSGACGTASVQHDKSKLEPH